MGYGGSWGWFVGCGVLLVFGVLVHGFVGGVVWVLVVLVCLSGKSIWCFWFVRVFFFRGVVMATAMTNVVEGVVSFRSPVAMQVKVSGGSRPSDLAVLLVMAVKGKWTTDATGTDGKITVSHVLPVGNDDNLVALQSSVVLDTVTAGASTNIVAVQ